MIELRMSRNSVCTRADNLGQKRHYETDLKNGKSYRVFSSEEKQAIIDYQRMNKSEV